MFRLRVRQDRCRPRCTRTRFRSLGCVLSEKAAGFAKAPRRLYGLLKEQRKPPPSI
ncbi:MAG TPA: hypothetical protein VFX06_06885 [Stellaceae bacterium]|nr:hypothetical protein [Stellaceae bacterium]